MSLPAAVVPVAVLVLAWDEATPAVRALLDATELEAPVLDSVVVLVPAKAGATQEEFLPLEPEPELPALATAVAASQPAAETPLPSAPALATGLALAEPTVPSLGAASQETAPTAAPLPALAAPTLPVSALAASSTVRVLHLSSFSVAELAALSSQALPQPIWVGSPLVPATPYLGSQPAPSTTATGPAATPTGQPTPAPLMSAPPVAEAPLAATQSLSLPALAIPATYLPGEPLPALDAEADLAPVLFDDLGEEAAPTGAAQAGWTEALASLRGPLPLEEPALAPAIEDKAAYSAAEPAELPLVRQPFEAPNLNFQVIQYARFAVPVALAQAPFAAIYAPAWPTWLAAQELRYRTRQPLVLHVATLAASEAESIETATSWQAELQRQALQRADLILAETPALTHRLRRDLGLPPELVRTVPAADAHAVALALRTARLRPTANPS